MRIHDARRIALQALAKGWLQPQDMWDAACRWALNGGTANPEEVFASAIDRVHLEQLLSEQSEAVTAIGDVSTQSPAWGPDEPPTVGRPVLRHLAGARYHVKEMLGRGGVGEVVAALDR